MLIRSIIRSFTHRQLPRKASSNSEEPASTAKPVNLQESQRTIVNPTSDLGQELAIVRTAAESRQDHHHHHHHHHHQPSYTDPVPIPSAPSSTVSEGANDTRQSTSSQQQTDQFRTPATSPLLNPLLSPHEEATPRQAAATHSTTPAASAAFPIDDLVLTHPQPSEYEEPIMQRKIWVKRPGGATNATQVTVNHDDLVDAVRDVILHKYANSLGKAIDSPDVTLRIVTRDPARGQVPAERELSPDEHIGDTLDEYYPGGQNISEALIIDVPELKTARKSPRINNYHSYAQPYPYMAEHMPPLDQAREYFPVMPSVSSPHLQHPPSHTASVNGMLLNPANAVRPLPSPGSRSSRYLPKRPAYGRTHTSSPTVVHGSQAHLDMQNTMPNGISPNPPALPTPPLTEHRPSITPPHRSSSPPTGPGQRTKKRVKQSKPINGDLSFSQKSAPTGLLYGTLPAINVLIVEDNVINLRLLEAFMKRLKVRWKTATDGKQAVEQWRKGGFHLVLMDLQMPVMNGLEATKEIRRLEGVNGIGIAVFGGTSSYVNPKGEGIKIEDRLGDIALFKSPVIIVALTASSLQSDRHEALAAGCNDFLTKPVNYPWMERKVTEWGCMQALIDFDGWRQWKAGASAKAKQEAGLTEEEKKKAAADEKARAREAIRAQMRKGPPSKKKDNPPSTNSTTTTSGSLNADGTAATTAETKAESVNGVETGEGTSPKNSTGGPTAILSNTAAAVGGGAAGHSQPRRSTASTSPNPNAKLETHHEAEEGEEEDEDVR